MQGFDLALFQQGAADQPSILLKHLDPNTRQEAQQDIAAYKTKLKDEREQKKQKTVQARAANLPADLTEQQRRRMGTPQTDAAMKRKRHPQTEDAKNRKRHPQTEDAKNRKSHKGQHLQRRKHATCIVCNEAKIRDAFTSHAWLKLTKKKERALCRTCTPKAVPSI
jgi:hypothetical protein